MEDNFECVMCGRKNQKWHLCKTCYQVMKKKYPKYNDFIMAIKLHKKERRRIKW
jgi:hypothetical protein